MQYYCIVVLTSLLLLVISLSDALNLSATNYPLLRWYMMTEVSWSYITAVNWEKNKEQYQLPIEFITNGTFLYDFSMTIFQQI